MSKSGLFAHFRSKEQLQLETLATHGSSSSTSMIRPSLAVPNGERRLRALLDLWLAWADESLGGGCLFVAAAVELDDRPGPLRAPSSPASWWRGLLRSVVQSAVTGEFATTSIPTSSPRAAPDAGLPPLEPAALSREEAATRTRSALERLVQRRPTV